MGFFMLKTNEKVRDFFDECAKYVGANAEELHEIKIENLCHEYCDSPIEQLVLAALLTVAEINYLQETTWGEFYVVYGKFSIEMQRKIHPYRVDFLIDKIWVIECDGHDFHERTKEQAKHDKKRDRFLTSKGYKILRFTGSEITADPIKIALEIWNNVIPAYDFLDPRGSI